MNIFLKAFLVSVCGAVVVCAETMSYLDNGQIRLGVDLDVGGAVTYLAEYVLCNLALGSFEGTIQEVKKSIWDILGLSPDSMSTLFTKAEIDVEKAVVVLEMETGGPNTQLRMV